MIVFSKHLQQRAYREIVLSVNESKFILKVDHHHKVTLPLSIYLSNAMLMNFI